MTHNHSKLEAANTPMTEAKLAKTHWWWRRTRFLFPRSSIDPNWHERREWNDGLEQTAFEYELVRRASKAKLLPPFVELDCRMQGRLHYRLCPPRKKSTRIMSDVAVFHTPPGEKPTRIDLGELTRRGLSESEVDDFRWNLEVADNQLLETMRMMKLPSEAELNSFLRGEVNEAEYQKILRAKRAALPSRTQLLAEINRRCVEQGIKRPRGLQGKRNRPVAWRWIELLDLAAFKIKGKVKDTDSDRQTKRRARVMARRLLPKYLSAFEEFEALLRRSDKKVRPLPLLAHEG